MFGYDPEVRQLLRGQVDGVGKACRDPDGRALGDTKFTNLSFSTEGATI